MGTLDSLRTWRDRNEPGQSHYRDHADAGNISRDTTNRNEARRDRSPEQVARDAGLPLTSIDQRTVARQDDVRRGVGDRLRRVTASSPIAARPEPLFIVVRPKADRYVFVLIRDLTAIDAEAGRIAREWYDRNRETLTVDKGSDWINRLKAKIADVSRNPGKANVVQTTEPNPKADAWAEWRAVAGELCMRANSTGARFAVPTEDGATNTLAFWWVVPGRGNHKGKFWLRQVIGGQGPIRVRMSPEAMTSVVRKALADPDSLARYGREMEHCGACGTELTNDESRAMGIGPECRRKGRG